MDIKLKRPNPFGAWLAFFIGIHLLIASTVGGVYLAWNTKDTMAKDYKDSQRFKGSIESNFDRLVQSIEANKEFGWDYSNILYFGDLEKDTGSRAENIQTNGGFKNFTEALSYLKNKTDGYDFLLTWDGSNMLVTQNNSELKLENDQIYSNMQIRYQREPDSKFKDMRILIAVRKSLPVRYGGIYSSYIEWRLLRAGVPAAAIAFAAGVILLIISSVKRTGRKQFTRKLGKLSGYFWIEIKALALIFILIIISVNDIIPKMFGLYLLFWWFYLMLLDLALNRTKFLTHNSLSWLMRIYRGYENKKPFQKKMFTRFILFIAVELFLMLFTFLSMVGNSAPIALILIGLGFYTFYRYIKSYIELITDIGKIVNQTEIIRNGDLKTRLNLPETSIMHKTAENLNHIQEGVSISAQEQLKSERMKIELITNVSHDLKTPLTSIVNYIDLLSREELVPEHANDYVKVLSKKAARLNALTQDLFDISKAHSGNLELNIEKIDIVELVKQSIAELEERIAESNLNFRINLPQEKIYINADGRKLFRVFDNLISNILKYSLSYTRVYIDLLEDKDSVTLSFKNIASYEMNVSPSELMERFVRGDEARSTEGSGLGLAIVRSFVSLCGGNFDIDIDGDLFKAIVRFKKS